MAGFPTKYQELFYDLACMVASLIVVGGVRRAACISLPDDRMASAKQNQFWESSPLRMLSNNSVSYAEKPEAQRSIKEWDELIKSGSGERGIFNRISADIIVVQTGRRETGYEWACTPCSEIILRPNGSATSPGWSWPQVTPWTRCAANFTW